MEIQGIPLQPGEDLVGVLQDISDKLHVEFISSDVQAIHRLPTRSDRTPPIIVQFLSVAAKDKWMRARKKVRAACENGLLPKGVFLNDNLTRANKELLWKVKARAKEYGHCFVWVKNGKIFVKKSHDATVLRVTCRMI